MPPILYHTIIVNPVHAACLVLQHRLQMKQKVAWIVPQASTLNERAYRMKKDALVAHRVSGVQLLVQQKSQSASTVVQESMGLMKSVLPIKSLAKIAVQGIF